MRDAAMHIARCRACELLLQQHERAHDALNQTIAADVDAIPPSSVWEGIAARVQSESSAVQRRARWRVLTPGAERPAAAVNGDDSLWLRSSKPAGFGLAPFTGLAAMAASVTLAVTLLFGERGAEEAGIASMGSASQVQQVQNVSAPATLGAAAPIVPVAGPPQGSLGSSFGSTTLNRSSAVAQPVSLGRPSGRPQGLGTGPDDPPSANAPIGQQVRIDKLNSRTGNMAMWSGPAQNTAVIWLADEAPGEPAAQPRVQPRVD